MVQPNPDCYIWYTHLIIQCQSQVCVNRVKYNIVHSADVYFVGEVRLLEEHCQQVMFLFLFSHLSFPFSYFPLLGTCPQKHACIAFAG